MQIIGLPELRPDLKNNNKKKNTCGSGHPTDPNFCSRLHNILLGSASGLNIFASFFPLRQPYEAI